MFLPSVFIWLMVTYFLDRPPSGFLGHPQGSNWPWTLPVTTSVAVPCPSKKTTGNKKQIIAVLVFSMGSIDRVGGALTWLKQSIG